MLPLRNNEIENIVSEIAGERAGRVMARKHVVKKTGKK